ETTGVEGELGSEAVAGFVGAAGEGSGVGVSPGGSGVVVCCCVVVWRGRRTWRGARRWGSVPPVEPALARVTAPGLGTKCRRIPIRLVRTSGPSRVRNQRVGTATYRVSP